jgi:ABC-type sugar transport system substrate-binding protein
MIFRDRRFPSGGSKGIELVAASALLKRGVALLSVARDSETLVGSVQEWKKQGLPVAAVAAGVSTQEGRSTVQSAASEQSGRLIFSFLS